MAELLKEIKNTKYMCYVGGAGNLRPDGGGWNSCRDTFLESLIYKESKNFYYRLSNKQKIEDLILILTGIENKLKLTEQIRIQPTSHKREFLFLVPVWWQNIVRMSFLTLIVKNRIAYIEKTKLAVEKFLQGNVYFHGSRFDGWVSSFKKNADLLQPTPLENKKPIKVKLFYAWGEHTIDLQEM